MPCSHYSARQNATRAAVQAAIEVTAGLDALNAQWEKRGIAPFRVGTGIHTGEVVVGVVVTSERRKYDVTGDGMNTGSRVEDLNREFGTTLLVARETVQKLDGEFALRRCGEAQSKGPGSSFRSLRSAWRR